jgi:hypothetical protein
MSENRSSVYRGRCLCGAVTYEIEGAAVVIAHCHCSNCQRGSGAGHSTGAMFPDDKFRLVGEIAEFKLVSDNGNEVTRVFCPKCGSPILGRNSGMVGFVTITLGTLDEPSGLSPQVVVFARNRKTWDVVEAALPTFDAQPVWKPEHGI